MKLDYIAMVTGVLGSFLVAVPNLYIRLFGFILFITGNILWMVFASKSKELKAIFILNACYFVSSLLGIVTNLINIIGITK